MLIFGLAACNQATSTPSATLPPTGAPLKTPPVYTTPVPDVREAAQAFLDAWQREDYEALYDMLAPASQDANPKDAFIQRYRDTAVNLTLKTIQPEVLSTLIESTRSAQAAYRVSYETNLVGTLTREMNMTFSLVDGSWRVMWEEGMILPELRGGNKLVMDYKTPSRGNIYDRDGYPIALTTDAVSLGVIPGQIGDGQEGTLLGQLSWLTGKPAEWIRALYAEAAPSWYIAVGETTKDLFNKRFDAVSNLGGLQWSEYRSRYYNDNGIAPHATGYVQFIPKEELETYRRLGYAGDEKVGMSGLEKWGEKYLAGQKGVGLYVVNSNGDTITRLAQAEVVPARDITTTLDANLQLEAQKAINSFRGAVVVLERDTGRVLAMVSSPGFDPNYFDPANLNFQALGDMLGDGRNRLFNRAAQSAGYPLGSVFKIVTMATALETGLFKPEDTYNCTYEFTDLPGVTLYDWTKEKELPPSGMLTLPEGLMRSCNPWFYHIGLELYTAGKEQELAKMARAFGFGATTGIEQVAESPGNIPDPASDYETVQMAIGQATMQVTPLQVARMIAAVGNGGTLYRPQLVEKITDPDGKAVFTFKPEKQGTLPVSKDNLALIQQTLRRVVNDRRGTAVQVFGGMSVPVYGKTGTAQNDTPGFPHAWFAGYTDAQQANKADIAIAVIAENAGEGSEIAAPIFRRIVEVWFLGKAQRLYPWEAKLNVTRTPVPTETPTPLFFAPTDTPAP